MANRVQLLIGVLVLTDGTSLATETNDNVVLSRGQPDIWRLPYGHVRICCGGVPGLPERVLRWLPPRMNK
jgi:hypothetical protein